ncbi:MAG: phosphatidylserine decarboxylase [Puniceicoccales bacterium]|jgi:phosphatidylserine decarboxylase|nr:phosphatidylserine decarboxylase [Puniceicoccales bacterium]
MSKSVVYFNRHANREETEHIYGGGPLRWIYETAPGRLALWLLVRRAIFSKLFGWWMRRPASRARIAPFIREYGLDAHEFEDAPETFRSFDDFFSRRLKPEARPVADTPVVFPADGRHLGFQDASNVPVIYAKGQSFDLAALLGDTALAERYRHGTLVCSRLCPVDYHRFHFPLDGTPGAPQLLNGWLYSVNPIALRLNISRLWQNKRWRITLDAGLHGRVTLVVIGATNVGRTTFTYPEGIPAPKAGEMGYFSFGGSFMITLFEAGKIRLSDDLLRETAAGRELYARMGSALGVFS